MEITSKNFKDVLPLIKEAIDEADFVAIDTELTGLSTQTTEHAFDTMPERYKKYRQNCSQFLIIQYGLSTFKYVPNENKYVHKDFNFYIFPNPYIKKAPDPRFVCQASSLQFLASHGFDFNKAIYEGISYLTPLEEENLKEYLENKHKSELETCLNSDPSKQNEQKTIAVPPEQKDFIEKIKKRVADFMANDSEKVLELEPCNSFVRKLIYQNLQIKHPSGLDISTNFNDQNQVFISITKVTDEEREAQLKLRQENEMVDLDSAIGFRKIIDLISQTKTLVIGHNLILDVMHTIDKFICPIPESLEDFKHIVNCTFPFIIDTKVLATSDKFRQLFTSTSLGELVNQLQGPNLGLPNIEAASDFTCYNVKDKKLHDAGFDAFVTGVTFLGLCKRLGSSESDIGNKQASQLFEPYLNKLFIMRHYDIPFLNIKGPDPEPKRNNVFHVTFPKEWKTGDLIELFSAYGDVFISWLDDVSALVSLKHIENLKNANKALLNNTNKLYSVKTYEEYQTLSGYAESAHHYINQSNSELINRKRVLPNVENIGKKKSDHQEKQLAEADIPNAKKLKVSPEETQKEESKSNISQMFPEENTW